MGYKVFYGKEMAIYRFSTAKKRHQNKKGIGVFALLIAAILLLAGVVSGMDKNNSTGASLNSLKENIVAGEDFVDAFTVFCRDIIENAKEVE